MDVSSWSVLAGVSSRLIHENKAKTTITEPRPETGQMEKKAYLLPIFWEI